MTSLMDLYGSDVSILADKIMQNPLYFPEIDGSSHPPFIHFTPPFNDTMLFWSGISPHSIGTMRTMGVFLVWGMGLLWIDQHKKNPYEILQPYRTSRIINSWIYIIKHYIYHYELLIYHYIYHY